MIAQVQLNDLINEDVLAIQDEDNLIDASLFDVIDLEEDLTILNNNETNYEAAGMIIGKTITTESEITDTKTFGNKIKDLIERIIEFIKKVIYKIHIFFVNADKYYKANSSKFKDRLIENIEVNVVSYADYDSAFKKLQLAYTMCFKNVSDILSAAKNGFKQDLSQYDSINKYIDEAKESINSLKSETTTGKESGWDSSKIKNVIDMFGKNGKIHSVCSNGITILNGIKSDKKNNSDYTDSEKYDVKCIHRIQVLNAAIYSKISPTLMKIMKAYVSVSK